MLGDDDDKLLKVGLEINITVANQPLLMNFGAIPIIITILVLE